MSNTKVVEGYKIPSKPFELGYYKNVFKHLTYLPIDFFKGRVKNKDLYDFAGFRHLSFNESIKHTELGEDSAPISLGFECNYKGIKIFVTSTGEVFVSGSLHYYFNNDKHNYNDFTKQKFEFAKDCFKQDFGIDFSEIELIQLEYGFNFRTPISVESIINHIYEHRNVRKTNKYRNKNEGFYTEFSHYRYRIKIYDKGTQNKLKMNNLMRFEINVKNWGLFRKKYKIYTLQDFANANKEPFILFLIDKWVNIIFFNPLNKKCLHYKNYDCENYWFDLREFRSYTTFSKHKKRLKKYNSNAEVDVQTEILRVICEKAIQLENN